MADLFRPYQNCSILDDGHGTINCTYVDEWEIKLNQSSKILDAYAKDLENDPGVIFATKLYEAAQIEMVNFVFVMMVALFAMMMFYVEIRFGGMFGKKKKGGSMTNSGSS